MAKILLWPIGFVMSRIAGFLVKKGPLGLILLLIFMNLDQMFPAFGGKITVTGLVLGPALAMGIYARLLYLGTGTITEYTILAWYMLFSGFYGLFRAWAAAAQTEVPDFLVTLALVVFGPVLNAIVGAIASYFDVGEYAPLPIAHADGLIAHLSALNPLLVKSTRLNCDRI